MKELLDPLSRHIQANAVGRKRRKGALTIINRFWGIKVTGFLCENVKSEKCLRQIAYFAAWPQMLLYPVARRTMNKYILNQLITRPSRQFGRFETTTADWLAVDNAVPLFHKISYARLYATGVHLGSFSEIREGRSPPRALDPLLISGINNISNGSGGNPPGLVGPGVNGGSNRFGGNPPGLVGPDVNGGSNGSGGNPPGLVEPGRNGLGLGGSDDKAVMSKKNTPSRVDDDGESISSLADHDSMDGEEDQSTDEDYNNKQPASSSWLIAISASPDLSAGGGGDAGFGSTGVMGAGAAVVSANAAEEPDLLDAKELFNEWLLCKRCGLWVIVCQIWWLKVCDRSD